MDGDDDIVADADNANNVNELLQRVAELEEPPVAAAPASKRAKKDAAVRTLPAPREPRIRARLGHLHGKFVAKLLARMGVFGQHVLLDCSPDAGLCVRQFHKDRILLAELLVPRASFAVYEMPAASAYKLFFEQVRGFVAGVGVDDTLTLTDVGEAPYVDRLRARTYSSERDCVRNFDTVDVNQDDRAMPVMEYASFAHPVRVVLSTAAFANLVAGCEKNGATLIEFAVDTKASTTLLCTARSDTSRMRQGTYEVALVVDELVAADGWRPQAFAVNFLELIASTKDVAESMTLRFGGAAPLHVALEARSHAGDTTPATLNIVLAPKNMADD